MTPHVEHTARHKEKRQRDDILHVCFVADNDNREIEKTGMRDRGFSERTLRGNPADVLKRNFHPTEAENFLVNFRADKDSWGEESIS